MHACIHACVQCMLHGKMPLGPPSVADAAAAAADPASAMLRRSCLAQGPDNRMVLQHCLLHVGISLMAGRLDMTDCTVKCTGDSLWAYPQTTLVLRRWGRGLCGQGHMVGSGVI